MPISLVLPHKRTQEDTNRDSVRRTFNPLVVGSNPTGPTEEYPDRAYDSSQSVLDGRPFGMSIAHRVLTAWRS